jgi:peptide-methionine (R)-S-oxide reductase
MKGLLTRLAVCLTSFALIGIGVSVAAGQDSGKSTGRKTADDSDSAAGKTEGSDSAAGDPAAKGTGSEKSSQKGKTKAKTEEEFVRKTDAEWRRILTRVQYMVTRQKATEPPFSGKYATGHYRGMFLCVCCEAELFSASSKFDSGTGWPSFDRPANEKAIERDMDYSALEPRVEVTCRRCGAHLGHVFPDGPTVTGMRFCINSAAIKLRAPEGASSSGKSSSQTTSRTSSKAKSKSKTKAAAKTRAKAKASSSSSKSSESNEAQPPADTTAPAAKPATQSGG